MIDGRELLASKSHVFRRDLELVETQTTRGRDLRGSEGYFPQKHPWEENMTFPAHPLRPTEFCKGKKTGTLLKSDLQH